MYPKPGPKVNRKSTSPRIVNAVNVLIVQSLDAVEREAKDAYLAKRDIRLSDLDRHVLANVHWRDRYDRGLMPNRAYESLVHLFTLGYLTQAQLAGCQG